jgi:hypothetical protein
VNHDCMQARLVIKEENCQSERVEDFRLISQGV